MNRLLCLVFVAGARLALAADADAPPFTADIAELKSARQLILSVAQEWDGIAAEVRFFEREKAGATWQPALAPSRAVVGRSGLAWGIGLHGGPPAGGSVKREGDGRSPAGVFALDEIFGYAPASEANVARFPYRALTAEMAGVDDPRSRYYNRIVSGVTPDWQSAEVMRRPDELYRWGVVVRHNWKPYPSYGSCIFIHLWESAERGSSGCTAMPAPAVEALVRWLDREKAPLLVQLPGTEYAARKADWQLP